MSENSRNEMSGLRIESEFGFRSLMIVNLDQTLTFICQYFELKDWKHKNGLLQSQKLYSKSNSRHLLEEID